MVTLLRPRFRQQSQVQRDVQVGQQTKQSAKKRIPHPIQKPGEIREGV